VSHAPPSRARAALTAVSIACAGRAEKAAGSTTMVMLRQGSSRPKAIVSCGMRGPCFPYYGYPYYGYPYYGYPHYGYPYYGYPHYGYPYYGYPYYGYPHYGSCRMRGPSSTLSAPCATPSYSRPEIALSPWSPVVDSRQSAAGSRQ
jgi:hypothetical protein